MGGEEVLTQVLGDGHHCIARIISLAASEPCYGVYWGL